MFSFDSHESAEADSMRTGRLSKGKRTRELIRRTALRSFRERGYENTTVRLIAEDAGVSVGVLNYHFPSKNELVQELYLEVTSEFRKTALARMLGVERLVDRLRIALETGLTVLGPFYHFAPEFLSASMSPRSSTNPLSAESVPALSNVQAVFQAVVGGAKDKLSRDIAESLPEALVIAYLLLALFWAYDASESQDRTQRVIDRSLGLLSVALPLLRMPALRKPIQELLRLAAEVRT